MNFRRIHRLLAGAAICLGMLLASPALTAQTAAPLTPRSNVPAHDKLKQSYEIPNFRLGGRYDLDASPDTWRDGGAGGATLESLGAGPLRVAYIAVGTPRRN